MLEDLVFRSVFEQLSRDLRHLEVRLPESGARLNALMGELRWKQQAKGRSLYGFLDP